jgi:hypothetical protein
MKTFGSKLLANFAVLAVAAILGLFAIDVFAYYFFTKPLPPPKGLYVADDTIGYRLSPSYIGSMPFHGPSMPIEINRHGFRGPDWQLDERTRVVIGGDSFTFGIPLSFESGFTAKLGNRLPGVAVYNVGVPGYGPGQISETIRRVCPQLKPRHIFYMYFLNDTRIDNVTMDWNTVIDGYLVPQKTESGRTLSKEELTDKIRQRADSGRTLLSSLRLLNLRSFLSSRGLAPRQLLERFSTSQSVPARAPAETDFAANAGYSSDTVQAAALQIETMAKTAKICGASFTMVVLPSYAEAYYGTDEPATKLLMRLLPAGTEVLDLRSFTRRFHSPSLSYDAHYSETGTDMVADALAGYLTGRYPHLVSRSKTSTEGAP